MRYQDMRVRDAGRVALVAGACSSAAFVSLIFPAETARLVEPLPLARHGDDYWVFVGVTALMALICWYVLIKSLISSPADDARTYAEIVAKGKSMPAKFNPALLDANDPAFSVPTWRYAFLKWRSGR